MNINDELYDLTERYLTGSLSGKELSEFEKRMEDDPDLKINTEKIRQVNELLFIEGLKGELPTIKKAEENYMFRQQLRYYGKWLGGIAFLTTTVSVIWTYSGSEEKRDEPPIVVSKKIISDSFPTSLTKEEKKTEQYSSVVSTPSPVIINKKEEEKIVTEKYDVPVFTNVQEVKQNDDSVSNRKDTQAISHVQPCRELLAGIFETTSACEYKNNGSIVLKSVSGGTKPYSISLDNKTFQETISFQFLSEGEYRVKIRDSKGCISDHYTVTITEKPCLISTRDYVFSYQNTQEWIFPEVTESDCLFYVYNSVGALVFSIPIINAIPSVWNGYGMNGQKLPLGLYSYRFVKSENIISQGSITIVD